MDWRGFQVEEPALDYDTVRPAGCALHALTDVRRQRSDLYIGMYAFFIFKLDVFNMVNILLSKLNFNEPWAYKQLSKYIRPNQRIAVLPFSFFIEDVYDVGSWNNSYAPGGKYYEEITSAFSAFGIGPEKVSFINYFEDSYADIETCIMHSDILFLTGGAPDLTMQRVKERNLTEVIKRFNGIVIGCSAGAMVQCSLFHITPSVKYPVFSHEPGIGLLPEQYGVEVHYTPGSYHDYYLRKTVFQTHRKIIILDNFSAAIFCNQKWKFIGNANVFNTSAADKEKIS